MEGCIDSPSSILVLAAVMMVGKLNYMKDTSRYVLCARISPNTTCQSFVIELHEGHIRYVFSPRISPTTPCQSFEIHAGHL